MSKFLRTIVIIVNIFFMGITFWYASHRTS